MQLIRVFFLVLLSLPLAIPALAAEEPAAAAADKEKTDRDVSPKIQEELKKFREQRKALFEALSPEAKEVLNKRREMRKKKYSERKAAKAADTPLNEHPDE